LETMVKKLYEGMFLVDSADAASDWDGVLRTIRTVLDRADAELVSMRKWDERKLAYDIDGKSRGTYILCYFRAEGSRIAGVERDVQLNDRLMRALILNAEHMSQADIDKATPAEMAERGELKREEEEETKGVNVGVEEEEGERAEEERGEGAEAEEEEETTEDEEKE
jgi:small subunit ribosomal protein S6